MKGDCKHGMPAAWCSVCTGTIRELAKPTGASVEQPMIRMLGPVAAPRPAPMAVPTAPAPRPRRIDGLEVAPGWEVRAAAPEPRCTRGQPLRAGVIPETDLGKQIQKARLARGWSKSELARRMGASRPAVRAWERGDYKPDKARLLRLRQVLGMWEARTA